MNRRDFLKLAFTALLTAVSPKGRPIMLPNSTNRYGDMLKDILSGVQGVDQSKVDLLQREMNELWLHEIKYRSWLRLQDNKIDFKNLSLPFEPLYSNVLTSPISNIEVPILGSYNHLILTGNGRTDSGTGYAEGAMIQFNGDTGSNYMHTGEGRLNNVTSGYQNTSYTSAIIGNFTTANALTNSVGGFFAFIQNIGSGFWKSFSTIYGLSNAGAGASLYTIVNFGVWKSTNKITSLNLVTETGSNIVPGSIISIYGIM